jgi:ketosteroid isomerase-like protein
MSATPREVAESYWRAEESRDITLILSHFHEDAVFYPVSGPLKGHAEIRTFYDGMSDAFPGLEVTITREISSGDAACLEWEAVLIDHDGGRIPIRGVNVVHVHDGKFDSVRAYFDPTQFSTTGGQQ